MELPRWVREKIWDDLRHPKEAKEQDRVERFSHVAWAENDESEAYDKDVDD